MIFSSCPSWFRIGVAAWLITIAPSTSSLAATPPSDASGPSPKQILAWLETFKFPNLQGSRYVEVTITETDPPAGQKPSFVQLDGLLLKDSGATFTVFVLTLQKNLATFYPMSDPPLWLWPLMIADFKKDSSEVKERATYKILGFDAEASALRKEFGLPNQDDINTKLWHEGFGRHLSKPAAIAIFASACRQNHREKLAEDLVDGISTTYERYLPDSEKEKPFPKYLEDAISETLVWRATLQFGDPTIPRDQLLATLRDLKERFPNSRYQSTIQQTIKLLELLVLEDHEHHAKPLADLTEEERIRELIFQLRDQNGAQQMQPGWCDIFARDDPKNPQSAGSQLLKIGYAAVPQLINALDDSRLTRSIHFHRGFYFSHYVLRVGDCAEQILERIANRKFYEPKATGSDMTSDREVASTKKAVVEWWAGFQKKGEKQSLIDAVRSGDENSPAQAEKLLQKYRDAAADAIIIGAKSSKRENIRAGLIELAGKIEGDQITQFLRSEMKEARGLPVRLAAAYALFDRGNGEAATAMIEEWKSLMPQSGKQRSANPDRDEMRRLVEFLTKCQRVDAVKVLAQSLPSLPADIRMDIVSGLAPNEHQPGLSHKTPTSDVGVDQAAEALFVSLLNDEALLSISGGIGEKDISYRMPRLCDFAAFVLARRLPQKYRFHWSLFWTENDRQRREVNNIWRKENALPPEPATLAIIGPVENRGKQSSIGIREIYCDSTISGKIQQHLQRLYGSSLTPDTLRDELKFLANNLPKGAHGFVFSAERVGTEPGFVVTVRWLETPRGAGGALWADDVIAGNESIPDEPFQTDQYKSVTTKFKQALAKDPFTPIAVHVFAASTSQ